MRAATGQKPEYYSESEMADILRVEVKTLRSRRSRGTNHPPYVQIGRYVLYPKELVNKWLMTLPVTWEVRRVC